MKLKTMAVLVGLAAALSGCGGTVAEEPSEAQGTTESFLTGNNCYVASCGNTTGTEKCFATKAALCASLKAEPCQGPKWLIPYVCGK